MFFFFDRYCCLGEIADIINLRSGINYNMQSGLLAVRRVVSSPDSVTLRINGQTPSSALGIIVHDDVEIIEDYVKFLLDSGVFYAEIMEKKGNRRPLHILKSDLEYFEIPLIDLRIQSALSKLELAWEMSINAISPFRYAGLRTAMFDEIRHVAAMELFFPERMHALNIYSIDALLEIDDYLAFPNELFNHLMLDQPEIMNQIKRFRSIVFER